MPENILDLIDKFDLYVFDIYGVLWNGKSVISGADKTLEELKKAGKKVLIMSNGTALSTKIEESYGKRGFIKGVHYDRIVSSGDAYHAYVLKDKRLLKFYQFGRPSKALFEGSQYIELAKPEDADFVYAGVPQIFDGEIWRDYLTIEPFADELLSLIKMNKTLVCANPDLKAFENQYDEPVIRQGSVAKFYVENGGDVGWDKLTTFVTEYQDALSQLAPGQMSGIVETTYGYHIIKCTDLFHVDGEVTSVDQIPEEIRDQFVQTIEQTAQSTAYNEWFEQYVADADIQINPMPEDVPYNVDMSAAGTQDGEDAQEEE